MTANHPDDRSPRQARVHNPGYDFIQLRIFEVWRRRQRLDQVGEANPAGRLPITFYQSVNQLPPFEDYKMTGRTYRYMTQAPLYPFGYGLSAGDPSPSIPDCPPR